jgi:SMC interacting uncharacterized protein involved in chromosome segregation
MKDDIKKKLKADPTLNNYQLAAIFKKDKTNMNFNSACWRARYELSEERVVQVEKQLELFKQEIEKLQAQLAARPISVDDF